MHAAKYEDDFDKNTKNPMLSDKIQNLRSVLKLNENVFSMHFIKLLTKRHKKMNSTTLYQENRVLGSTLLYNA